MTDDINPVPSADSPQVPGPTPAPKPPAPKPPEPTPLTAGHLAALVGIVALTVIAIVLYSQERTIDDLVSQVANRGANSRRWPRR